MVLQSNLASGINRYVYSWPEADLNPHLNPQRSPHAPPSPDCGRRGRVWGIHARQSPPQSPPFKSGVYSSPSPPDERLVRNSLAGEESDGRAAWLGEL